MHAIPGFLWVEGFDTVTDLRSSSSSTLHHCPVHVGEHEQTTIFPTLRHSPCTHRSTQDCDGVVVDDVVIVVVVFVDVVSFDDSAESLRLLVQAIRKFVR